MWTIILTILFPALILFSLVRVMIYGKSIVKPDFERVDEKLTAKTGFNSYWNTWYGKAIYYILLIGLLTFTAAIILAAL